MDGGFGGCDGSFGAGGHGGGHGHGCDHSGDGPGLDGGGGDGESYGSFLYRAIFGSRRSMTIAAVGLLLLIASLVVMNWIGSQIGA